MRSNKDKYSKSYTERNLARKSYMARLKDECKRLNWPRSTFHLQLLKMEKSDNFDYLAGLLGKLP
jgi:hypothetical protein